MYSRIREPDCFRTPEAIDDTLNYYTLELFCLQEKHSSFRGHDTKTSPQKTNCIQILLQWYVIRFFWISAKSKLVPKRCNLYAQKLRQISVVPYFLSWSDCMHWCCNCYLGLTPAIKICRHKENRKGATQPIFCLEIASLDSFRRMLHHMIN